MHSLVIKYMNKITTECYIIVRNRIMVLRRWQHVNSVRLISPLTLLHFSQYCRINIKKLRILLQGPLLRFLTKKQWHNPAPADANFFFTNGRCHLEQSLPFSLTVDAICNIYAVKRMWTALNRVVGVVVVYRTRMLAFTGSKHGNSLFSVI